LELAIDKAMSIQSKGAEQRSIYRKLPNDIFIELQGSVLIFCFNLLPKAKQTAK